MTGYESTRFTVDVLGRNICNTLDEAAGNSEAIDVVVLGSGMYGAYVAAEVYNRSATACYTRDKSYANRRPLRVLVLEAGPFLIHEHAQNLPNVGLGIPGERYVGSGSNPQTENAVWGFGWRSNKDYTGTAYCVGGKSIYWGGWCPRQHLVRDLPQWPKEFQYFLLEKPFPNPQPYSSIAKVKGAYEYLEFQTGVQPSEDFVFDTNQVDPTNVEAGLNKVLLTYMNELDKKIGIKTTVAPLAVSTRSDASGLLANNKFSSLPLLVSAIRSDRDSSSDDPRIAIVPFCHARKLVCRKDVHGNETRTIEKIEVMERGVKKTITIAPTCQVVLAMYAIESTRIALESFSLVSNGLKPPGQELMGNNLHTHLRLDFIFRFPRSFLDNYAQKKISRKLATLLQVAVLHVDGVTKKEDLQYQFQLFSAANSSGSGTADDILYRLVPSLDLVRVISAHQNSDYISLILRGSAEMPTNRSSVRSQDFIDLTQDPADDDHLNEHKRAWVQWGEHDSDQIWKTMYDKAVEISEQFGAVEYSHGYNDWRPKPRELAHIQQGLGTTYHDAGTLWMGDDPDNSVADTNGHFHHVSNAYIADQAAFSTNAVANPVPIGLAVARKVAEDIFSRHLSYHSAPTDEAGFAPLITSLAQFRAEWSSVRPGTIEFYPGQDLSGPPAAWVLETFPDPSGIGFIYFNKQQFSDYELRVQYKAFRTPAGQEEANAGILNLLGAIDGSPITESYHKSIVEIQIDESAKNWRGEGITPIYGDSRHKTGAVYGVAPATQWAAKVAAPYNTDGYWNEFRITVIASKRTVSVVLNDKEVVSNATIPDTKNHTGFVGLQVHSGKVQFKNLRIKDLALSHARQ